MKISDMLNNSEIVKDARVFIASDGIKIVFKEIEYNVELERFGIKNDGTFPKETSKGINEALQYAKEKGYEKIIFPNGNYLISELDPIVIDLKNVVIDLNQSIFQINTNGLESYSIIEIVDGAENLRLTNGIVRGDKDTHDYDTIKTPHEWGHGIVFKSGINLEIDNITITNVTGYGIYTESGNTENRFHTLYTKDVVLGSISEEGIMIESNQKSRTKEAYDISMCGAQFELGYTLGYQGYPYLKNKEYTSFFYDQNMNFIEMKECLQFRKVDIPESAKYVHFVYEQINIESNLSYYAWISNFKPSKNVRLHDCMMIENRSLGLGYCGGQKWTIENNLFQGNKGNAPGYAVDFEDGWELMQDVIFKNNRFIDNGGDLVVSAGDNFLFEGNEFTKTVYVWPRTTNYEFKANKFNGLSVTYRVGDTKCNIIGNYYNGTSIRTLPVLEEDINYILFNETIVESSIDVCEGTKLIQCNIISNNIKPFMKNVIIENSIIEVLDAEVVDLKFVDSKIKNAKWNLQNSHYFEGCELIDSNFYTYSNTNNIYFKKSNLKNCQIKFNTWGSQSEVILDECEVMTELDISLIALSAGRAKMLNLINNKINNNSNKPIIDIFDTHYTKPDGNIVLENNEFKQENYPYILDGKDINEGIINFTNKDNSVLGAEMLSQKYINNPYFNII